MNTKGFKRNIAWGRDKNNPILPPVKDSDFGINVCMNPHVIRRDDKYYMYYAGDFEDGRKKICLATASVDNLSKWERQGPLFENGSKGEFDSHWCVLPHIIQMDENLWYMYYTGNNGDDGGSKNSLKSFPGIGLAISKDGIHWEKYDKNPVLAASGIDGDDDAIGVAGGSVIKTVLDDGKVQYHFYYTGCPSTGDDYFLHQQKRCCLAVSEDGINWEKKGAVFKRHPDHDYENVAVAGPVVMKDDDGLYRMWYSAIGTRWGYYSICYAESEDGINWFRGNYYGENLQIGPDLGPLTTGYHDVRWDSQMAAYPSIIKEGKKYRLFYSGNGYGAGGIGTAVSHPLRVEPLINTGCKVRVTSHELGKSWFIRIPDVLVCDEGVIIGDKKPNIDWKGPDPDCNIWYEWENEIMKIGIRVILLHKEDGIIIRFAIINNSDTTLHNLKLGALLIPSEGTSQVGISWESSSESCSNVNSTNPHTILKQLNARQIATVCGKIRLL